MAHPAEDSFDCWPSHAKEADEKGFQEVLMAISLFAFVRSESMNCGWWTVGVETKNEDDDAWADT
jgi:hypothetical protein